MRGNYIRVAPRPNFSFFSCVTPARPAAECDLRILCSRVRCCAGFPIRICRNGYRTVCRSRNSNGPRDRHMRRMPGNIAVPMSPEKEGKIRRGARCCPVLPAWFALYDICVTMRGQCNARLGPFAPKARTVAEGALRQRRQRDFFDFFARKNGGRPGPSPANSYLILWYPIRLF